ncbi:MAG: hypothetical protein M3Y91_06750 [Actinomycetota bacterium]|nr:hypothetical protein [Actinomycetota bacterium]
MSANLQHGIERDGITVNCHHSHYDGRSLACIAFSNWPVGAECYTVTAASPAALAAWWADVHATVVAALDLMADGEVAP